MTNNNTNTRQTDRPVPTPPKPTGDFAKLCQRYWRKYPVAIAITGILVVGGGITLWLGRPAPQQVEVTAVNHGEVPPAPTDPVNDSQALAQQLLAKREQSTRTVLARLQTEVGNALSSRAADYKTFAQTVYQTELQKAQQENRNPAYASPNEVLFGLLNVKAAELTAAQQARQPQNVNSVILEIIACSAAIESTINPAGGKPIELRTTIAATDPTRQPSPILTAQAVQAWHMDLVASDEAARQAYEIAIAAQQRAAQQSQVAPPAAPIAQPVVMQGGSPP